MLRRTLMAAVAAMTLAGGPVWAKDWKTVRIGVEGAYPPFSETGPDGKITGFDIDIGHALCDAMKVKCTLVKQDFDGMIPALMAHKFDAILASMSITPERQKRVAFTDKYYQTPARFVCKKGSGIKISKDGLEGKTVGVQRSTIHDSYLTDNYGSDTTIKRYGTQDEAYLDLNAGRLNCVLADSIALSDGFLKTPKGKGYEFVGPPLTDPRWFGEGAGIAMRKGDDDLKAKFDKAIAQIRKDGTYAKIEKKYFDFDVYGAQS